MRKSGNSIRTRAMEQPSKRAQIVPGMRAYSAHNRLHVNAPTLCRFAQSYIIGGTRLGGSPRRRTAKILATTDRAPRESRQDSLRCYSGYRFPPEIIQHAIWRPFKKRGLPKAIRSDNGVPFASPNALFNLSKLAVWWLRLGIHIERIKPGPPQHRRHERMHLTLKKETTRPSGMNYLRQQERFDDFR
jgi:hypothetical protein